ncbi:DNA-invertase hin [Rubripirellula amarantea]|uniref:DNA-invertase hin n=1 Tax=Rubripirellula amarantea TaxID=2527999 RepID=A0A5C5WJQ5_9BACT|nr:recombinase family protein [Rubripirellula amarantea]TWT51006.1 DNA-invertase hin [Rubripirellula amarantea]
MNSKADQATSKPIRCAIYTRKSTEEGLDQEFNSLDAQREAGEAFIASQAAEGWVCVNTKYDDGGFTGGNLERPAYRRLITDIEAGKIDCVVVYKVDRLSRSLMDFTRIMETLDKHSVSFVSVTQQFNTTHSMGRLTLNILLSFAQFEREIIGERIRDKIAATRKKGQWCGGFPILGYDIDRSGPTLKLVIDADEARKVREIFDLYLELGSLSPVVQAIATKGWKTKSWRTRKGKLRGGRDFSRSAVHALLTNPLYIGKVTHKENVYDGQHEAIVDSEIFEQVKERLKANCMPEARQLVNKHAALLRGMIVCPLCDRPMQHSMTRNRSQFYRYYICRSRPNESGDDCEMGSMSAPMIEAAVVDEIRAVVADETLRRTVHEHIERSLAKDKATLQTTVTQIREQRNRDLAEMTRINQRETFERFADDRLSDLSDRTDLATIQLPVAMHQLSTWNDRRISRDELNAILSDFDRVWKMLTPKECVEVIGLLVDRVVYDPDQGELTITHRLSDAAANSETLGEVAV